MQYFWNLVSSDPLDLASSAYSDTMFPYCLSFSPCFSHNKSLGHYDDSETTLSEGVGSEAQ